MTDPGSGGSGGIGDPGGSGDPGGGGDPGGSPGVEESHTPYLFPESPGTVIRVEALHLNTIPSFRESDVLPAPGGRYLVSSEGAPVTLHMLEPDGSPAGSQQYDRTPESTPQEWYSFAASDRFVLVAREDTADSYQAYVVDAEGVLSGVAEIPYHEPTFVLSAPRMRLAETGNGSFVLLMARKFAHDGFRDQIVRFDAAGQVYWHLTDFAALPELAVTPTDVAGVSDGGLVVIGTAPVTEPETREVSVLLRYDASGQLLWHRRYVGRLYGQLTQVFALEDGHLLLCGRNQGPGGTHGWFVEVDAAGDVVWDSEAKWTAAHRYEMGQSVGLNDYPVQLVRRDAGWTEVVLYERRPPTIGHSTLLVDAEGTLVHPYDWAFGYELDGLECRPERLRLTADDELVVLAECVRITRLGSQEWESDVTEVIFRLQP